MMIRDILKRRFTSPPLNKTIKLTWFDNKNDLAEIYQITGMLFSFVSDKYEVCHDWVKCRDFLHDAVRSVVTKQKVKIYGFEYSVENNPLIDLKTMRMAVTKDGLNSDKEIKLFRKMMYSALNLLNHFEDEAGVKRTEIKEVCPEGSGKKIVFLFESDEMWIKSPFLISMYTFILRLGYKCIEFNSKKDLINKMKKLSKITETNDVDCGYLKFLHDKLHFIIKNRKKLFKLKNNIHEINFNKNIPIGSFHDRCGILSLVKGITPDANLNNKIKESLHK